METKKDEKLINEFTRLMYQKGYRGRFFLDLSRQIDICIKDELNVCLKEIIKTTANDAYKKDHYQLDALTKDNIQCSFRLTFDEKEGFLVREMTMENKHTLDKKSFHLINNQLMMGSQGVSALFPKPKPWQHIVKNKFRP